MSFPLDLNIKPGDPVVKVPAQWFMDVTNFLNHLTSNNDNVTITIPAVPTQQNPVTIDVDATGGSGSGLPAVSAADAGKPVLVNDAGDGYELAGIRLQETETATNASQMLYWSHSDQRWKLLPTPSTSNTDPFIEVGASTYILTAGKSQAGGAFSDFPRWEVLAAPASSIPTMSASTLNMYLRSDASSPYNTPFWDYVRAT